MQARSVGASHGWGWVQDSFELFKKNPVIWIVLLVIYSVINVVLSKVPLIGPFVLNILAPVFIAGLMLGCRALENGEELEINHLFAGFKQNTTQLIAVGGLYMLGLIVIAIIIYVAGGKPDLSALNANPQDIEKASMAATSGSMLVVAVLAFVALLPLVMAYWFAPSLVFFHDMKAVDAMRTSFNACLKNLLPFTVFSLILIVLVFSCSLIFVALSPFATTPVARDILMGIYTLGFFLLLVPSMMASLYVSYKDIFEPPPIGGGEIAM